MIPLSTEILQATVFGLIAFLIIAFVIYLFIKHGNKN